MHLFELSNRLSRLNSKNDSKFSSEILEDSWKTLTNWVQNRQYLKFKWQNEQTSLGLLL